MDSTSSPMRDLARQLLAASRTASGPHVPEVVAASERLRISLSKFAGVEGFASLQRRALLLASAEVPLLQSVKIGAAGRLEGFEQSVADTPVGVEAAVAITAHLLTLLVTFIGGTLTLSLLREAWPDITLDQYKSRIKVD